MMDLKVINTEHERRTSREENKMSIRFVVALTTALFVTTPVWSCPFCGAPSLTLTEQLDDAQAAVLVQWAGGEEPKQISIDTESDDLGERNFGSTHYEIIEIVHDESKTLKKGSTIRLDRFRSANKGDLFVLLGTIIDNKVEWSSPLEVTETAFNYMKQAPSRETAPSARLTYFLNFLEYPDPLIATDAYGEFANAAYKDVVPLRTQMDPAKLRKWISDPSVTPTRTGLYGMMLGLCGDKETDGAFLKAKILEPTEDFRLGIDGVMGGYLLLTGAEGLDVIDETKLRNQDAPFSETFAAMQALRFLWTYSNETVPKKRLQQSMEVLLERPNLTDLVIVDLARWDDWDVMDRLMAIYGKDAYDVPSVKRAIVRFMLIAEKETWTGEEEPAFIAKAKQNLAHFRETDPKTVKQAERYFFD